MTHDYPPQVVSGLSLTVAGFVLTAVIDEAAKTATIELRGGIVNGEKAAIEAAAALLAGRLRRFRPDLRLVSEQNGGER